MLKINKIEKLSHLSFDIKIFLKLYPWKNCKPSKSQSPHKKLNESKVSIISSAGLSIQNKQEPFNSKIKGGDCSFRIIPSNINMAELRESHRSKTFDHSGIRSNPSTAMPIPQLEDLVNEGFIGSINNRHFSFMGSIINTRELIHDSIPKIISMLTEDKVDIVLFIPI